MWSEWFFYVGTLIDQYHKMISLISHPQMQCIESDLGLGNQDDKELAGGTPLSWFLINQSHTTLFD